MGYRSDIAIAIHKKHITENLINPFLPDDLQQYFIGEKEDCYYYFMSGWKWYSSYPEVQGYESLFELLHSKTLEEQDSISFGAIRLGEDSGDIETWGRPDHFGLYIHSEISFPMLTNQ